MIRKKGFRFDSSNGLEKRLHTWSLREFWMKTKREIDASFEFDIQPRFCVTTGMSVMPVGTDDLQALNGLPCAG
jgi:hypothetical protein